MRIVIVAALALGACQEGSSPPGNILENSLVAEPAVLANGTEPAPVATAPLTPPTSGPIPAAFRGRWGMTPADCTSTRGDAKGLLVIDAESLLFYESRAIPKEITRNGPNEWRANLEYTGEGQTWSEITTVTLLNEGKTLRRMGDGPWTYQRCGDA